MTPWLNEPAYWSAWWHCPTPIYGDDIFTADYVYITHWHFDHFDPKTLKKFDLERTTVMVPQFPVSGLKHQLEQIGFKHIVEMVHGQKMPLGDDFSLTSYQVSFQDDSVAVVEADGAVLVDLNDAKPLPSTWRTFRGRYPKPDFMLRSHSPAWSYPTRYSFEDPADRLPVDAKTYMEAFVAAAQQLRPRYAIPLASGVCHLHKEVMDENRFLVSALDMQEYFEKNASRVPGTQSSSCRRGAAGPRRRALRAPKSRERPVSWSQQRAPRWTNACKRRTVRRRRKSSHSKISKRISRSFSPRQLLVRPFTNVRWSFR